MTDGFMIFKNAIQEHFKEMTKDVTHVFNTNFERELLWNTYLDAFPAGTNEIFRKKREFDCNNCKHMIKRVGGLVTIKDGEVHTIWELDIDDPTFSVVAKAMDEFVKKQPVMDIYLSKEKNIVCDHNHELIDGKSHTWEHLYLELPDKFVHRGHTSVESEIAPYRDTRNVFKRSLTEISMNAIDCVLELIDSNTLYKGAEWSVPIKELKKLKKEYDKVDDNKKENWLWETSIKIGPVIGKIKKHSIGVLLTDITSGTDFDAAVRRYEQIVAPTNYKRSKPIFTKKMLDDAQKTITELGYLDSLPRRYANLNDITVNNILFCNRNTAKNVSGAMDIFGELAKETKSSAKKFSKVEEVSAEDFINKILPTANELEVYLENKHVNNFVSLIAPVNKDSKSMFKWNNSMSWAYTGNITDSDIKENVKLAGGNVNGCLRFSIQWSGNGSKDNSDLDAHCKEPDKNEIYFAKKVGHLSGSLDVDIIEPLEDERAKRNNGIAVENIVYTNKSKMKPGTYKFFVNQYSARNSQGFKAEIEMDGNLYSFEYYHPVSGYVHVAEVTLHKDGTFTINPLLDANESSISKDVWNLKTNEFIPVTVTCYSPNYWDEQTGIGHKHLFFMLKDCKNSDSPNGYFNEYLKEELYQKHRKVFEALGYKCKVEDSDEQLSGIGFSMTKRAELVVKVKGATERVMKIKF